MSTNTIRILLLEDSDIDAELLSAHLEKARLEFDLERVFNRRDFVAAVERGNHDIVLADYSLPDFDGLSALNIATNLRPELPFIFVSGVVGEEFATNAMKRGAADYVVKRSLSRLATAIERAIEQARERAVAKQTQDALNRAGVNVRLATEAARLGVWDYDPASRELNWDATARAMLEWPPGEPLDYQRFWTPATRRIARACTRLFAMPPPGERVETAHSTPTSGSGLFTGANAGWQRAGKLCSKVESVFASSECSATSLRNSAPRRCSKI